MGLLSKVVASEVLFKGENVAIFNFCGNKPVEKYWFIVKAKGIIRYSLTFSLPYMTEISVVIRQWT